MNPTPVNLALFVYVSTHYYETMKYKCRLTTIKMLSCLGGLEVLGFIPGSDKDSLGLLFCFVVVVFTFLVQNIICHEDC